MPSAGHKEAMESTDFDRVFRPFALRKGIDVASINYFGAPREGVEENPVDVLDGGALLSPPPAPVIQGVAHISVSCFASTNTTL